VFCCTNRFLWRRLFCSCRFWNIFTGRANSKFSIISFFYFLFSPCLENFYQGRGRLKSLRDALETSQTFSLGDFKWKPPAKHMDNPQLRLKCDGCTSSHLKSEFEQLGLGKKNSCDMGWPTEKSSAATIYRASAVPHSHVSCLCQSFFLGKANEPVSSCLGAVSGLLRSW
jgi:hypothetical protein